MDFYLGILLLYLVYYGTVRSLPYVLMALWWLLGWTVEGLRIVCLWLWRLALRGLRTLIGRAIWELYGKEKSRRKQEEKARGGKKATPRERYKQALAQLGLEDGFSRAAFERAYRQAMMKAHPDRGGSEEQAKALNAARNVIRARHGWW